MRIFMDCEFTGLHQHTTLISIALVADDDKIFYAELTDYDPGQVNEWIQKNVIDALQGQEWKPQSNVTFYHGDHAGLRDAVGNWLAQYAVEGVQVWSDVYAWDWVLFCEIFGSALHLPRGVFYMPFDLATYMQVMGMDPDIDRDEFAIGGHMPLARSSKHNALADALSIRECIRRLDRLPKTVG